MREGRCAYRVLWWGNAWEGHFDSSKLKKKKRIGKRNGIKKNADLGIRLSQVCLPPAPVPTLI